MQEMRDELLQATSVALHTSRKIRIVLKPTIEGFEGVRSLTRMEWTDLISLPPIKADEYRSLLKLPASTPENQTVIWDGYWADVRNRTIIIELNEVFVHNRKNYTEYFRDRLYKSVESVEVVEQIDTDQ